MFLGDVLSIFAGCYAIACARNILTIVDNTFLTSYQQRPLQQGADCVVYSATKYLAGHNDVVAGAVVARTLELAERVAFGIHDRLLRLSVGIEDADDLIADLQQVL